MPHTKMRRARLFRAMGRLGLDALFVNNPANIYYLTSFDAADSFLLLGPRRRVLVTDFRFAEAAAKALPGFTILSRPDRRKAGLRSLVKRGRIKRLGFESLSLSHSRYMRYGRIFGPARFVATDGLVEELRRVKDAAEIRAIRGAIRIAKKGLRACLRRLRPGSRERDIAGFFESVVLTEGAEGLAFDPIIAAAPRSSEPHYKAAMKRVGRNKPVLMDVGVRFKRYNCDLTRMAFLDKISGKFYDIYNVVKESQKRAIAIMRPGVPIAAVDRAARGLLEGKGFGRAFGHALGHGVGLDIHERPAVSSRAKGVLEEGMVLTIEPGIYIPGFGGVRVEDMVLVKERGCEVLTGDIDK